MMNFLSNLPAGTLLFGAVAVFSAMAVVLAVTVYKCARGAWKLMFHH